MDLSTCGQNKSGDVSSDVASLNDSDLNRMPCDGRFAWTTHGPLVALSFLIIAFNSIVVALIYWKVSLRTHSNIILVSLAVSDLMSGLFGVPLIFACSLSVTRILRQGPLNACVFSVLFIRFTAVSTVLHFVLVACDRYILIILPLLSHRHVTLARVRCALLVIWIISPLVATIQLSWYNAGNLLEMKDQDVVYFLFLIVAFFAVPLAVMLCIYSHIIAVTIHHLRAMRIRRDISRSIARDMRGTVILILMLIVFSACWFPFFMMIFQSHVHVEIFYFSSWSCYTLFARFIPPITNPIFCVFCKRDIRNSLRTSARSYKDRFAQLCDVICKKAQPNNGNFRHASSSQNMSKL